MRSLRWNSSWVGGSCRENKPQFARHGRCGGPTESNRRAGRRLRLARPGRHRHPLGGGPLRRRLRCARSRRLPAPVRRQSPVWEVVPPHRLDGGAGRPAGARLRDSLPAGRGLQMGRCPHGRHGRGGGRPGLLSDQRHDLGHEFARGAHRAHPWPVPAESDPDSSASMARRPRMARWPSVCSGYLERSDSSLVHMVEDLERPAGPSPESLRQTGFISMMWRGCSGPSIAPWLKGASRL